MEEQSKGSRTTQIESPFNGFDSSSQEVLSPERRIRERKEPSDSWHRLKIKLLAFSVLDEYFCMKRGNQLDSKRSLGRRFASHVLIPIADPFPRCMFRLNGKPLYVWNVFLVFMLSYTAILMPFSMSFIDVVYGDTWFIIDTVINTLFFIDIIVILFSPYTNREGELICDRGKIFVQYLKSWLIIDLLACVPVGLIDTTSDDDKSAEEYNGLLRLFRLNRFYRILKLFRLTRIVKYSRTSELFDQIQDSLNIKHNTRKIITSFLTIIVCVHITTCLWYLLAKLEGFHYETWVSLANDIDLSIGHLYLTSMYWTFTTMVTVGYGDISPKTYHEQIFAIVWMFVGLFFVSFTLGSLSLILQSIQSKEEVLSKKLSFIDEFAEAKHLSNELKLTLKRAIKYSSDKKGYSWNEKKSLFYELPKGLRYQISLAMHQGGIRTIKFFYKKDIGFIADVVPFLEPMYIIDQETIYMKNEHANEIYFITSGKIVYKHHSECLFTLHSGDHFGDIEVLLGMKRKYYAVAEIESELLIMKKELLNVVKRNYFSIWEQLKENAESRNNKCIKKAIKLDVKFRVKTRQEVIDQDTLKRRVEKLYWIQTLDTKDRVIRTTSTGKISNEKVYRRSREIFRKLNRIKSVMQALDEDLHRILKKVPTPV